MSPVLTTILISLAKTIGLIFIIILPMVSYTVYAERRVSASEAQNSPCFI